MNDHQLQPLFEEYCIPSKSDSHYSNYYIVLQQTHLYILSHLHRTCVASSIKRTTTASTLFCTTFNKTLVFVTKITGQLYSK